MRPSRCVAALVLATASLLSAPMSAGATSPSAAVDNYRYAGNSAYFESSVGGVRTSVSVSEYSEGLSGRDRAGFLSVHQNSRAGSTYVSGPVDANLIDFARNLSTASAVDVPVTISRYDWSAPYGAAPTTRQGLITVRFEGVGDITRNATHQTLCGDGESQCQSIRVEANRSATGTLTGAGLDASGQGQIWVGRAVDAALFRPETAPE